MQQLSLFDFGDDTPKQEKKKKPSQKDTSPSKKEGNNDNDAVADSEVQSSVAHPVPDVQDQIINENPADNENNDPSRENIGSAERPDNQSKEESTAPESTQRDQGWNAEIVNNQEKTGSQPPPVNEIAEAGDHTKEGQLARGEFPSVESDAEMTHIAADTNTPDNAVTPDPTSVAEPAPEVAAETSQTAQNNNHDIVFSDEQIIVKFKPKSSGVNIENKETSVDPSAQEKPDVEDLNTQNTESEATEAAIQANQSETSALDTSFLPLADTKSDDQEKKIDRDSKLVPDDASATMADGETEGAESQMQINDTSAAGSEDLNYNVEGDPASDAPSQTIATSQSPDQSTTEGSVTEGPQKKSTENFTSDDNNHLGDGNGQKVESEQDSPILPNNIYNNTRSEATTASIDLALAETVSEKPVVHEREETKSIQPAVAHKRGRKSFKEIDAEVDLIDVPSDEELFKKQYYPISVVAKWFRVNNSLLRFWENEFKILKPKKNTKGDRFFRPEDVKNLQIIYYLLRQKKLTINGAIKHLKSKKEHTEVNLQIIQSLGEFKSFLLELRATTEK